MNLSNLFLLQKKLDELIAEKHLNADSQVFIQKLLALETEIGELSNETKCFKYWSINKDINKENLLEEYVDCLHFILSLGIDKGYFDLTLNFDKSEYNLDIQLLNLHIDVSDFYMCSSIDNYSTLFNDFISLGFSLNFTLDEIESAYVKKNLINIERQYNNY